MNKLEITSLVSKVLGVYVIIQSLTHFQAFGFQLSFTSGTEMHISTVTLVAYSLVPALVLLAAGIVMFFYSDRIAKRIISPSDAKDQGNSLTTLEVEVVACSIVGLFVLVHALPQVMNIALSMTVFANAYPERSILSPKIQIELAVTIVKLILGIWLLLGSRGIVRAFRWLRQTGA